MLVYRVAHPLVCTQRAPGLDHQRLLVLTDSAGLPAVATDPVGARDGTYVFTVTGTAARWAMGDYDVLTDLAVCGIVDDWDDHTELAGPPDAAQAQDTGTQDHHPTDQQETG